MLSNIFIRHCRRSILGAFIALSLATYLSTGFAQGQQGENTSPDYEVWAMDQGTHVVHIFNASLEEIATIDLGAQGAKVPHMIEFTSDYRYAFVASPASGNVTGTEPGDHAPRGGGRNPWLLCD